MKGVTHELQASNHTLREALGNIATADIWQNKYAKFADDAKKIATDALSATPAESLQAFENSVIEKCANVASLAFDSNDIVDAILELKEVK